jgi:adenosylhomocysteine nucleosidase
LSKLGIIAALPAEAACLTNKKLDIASPVEIQKDIYLCLSGMGYESSSTAVKKCLDFNIDGLISWGVAGALEPSLNSGDIVFAETIINQDKTYPTSDDWKNKLLDHFSKTDFKILNANIASSLEICATATDKNRLLNKTGAIAVDMESAAIADIAIKHELDFLVIRAIADEANTSIPEAVLKFTDNLGKPEIFNFVSSCISKPTQIREITKLAKSYKIALNTLSHIAPDLKTQNFFYV